MKTIIRLNEKKISKKAAADRFGKELIEKYISEAWEGFKIDPQEEQSWYIGGAGILVIEFEL